MDIVRCHSSEDALLKLQDLMRFKRVLSVQAPEFEGSGNKVSQLLSVCKLLRLCINSNLCVCISVCSGRP